MFWNIWYIFINDDSMASAQLLASVYEGVQQSLLLSGADLATVTRLHWGDPRGCLYNCFADWKNKSPPTSSVNQAVFHNDYVEKNVEPFSVLLHGQQISLNASRLANLPVSQTKKTQNTFIIISASASLSPNTCQKRVHANVRAYVFCVRVYVFCVRV